MITKPELEAQVAAVYQEAMDTINEHVEMQGETETLPITHLKQIESKHVVWLDEAFDLEGGNEESVQAIFIHPESGRACVYYNSDGNYDFAEICLDHIHPLDLIHMVGILTP